MVSVSTISMTVRWGARGRCMTPFGMTTPWRGPRSMVRGLSCGGGVLGIDEIDEQTAFDDVEELVLPLMIVPVIVSLHDA